MIDTRSYAEIYDSLDSFQRSELISALMKDMICADSTLRNYRLGNRAPKPIYQRQMAKTIKRVLGIEVSLAHLFPDSQYAKRLRADR